MYTNQTDFNIFTSSIIFRDIYIYHHRETERINPVIDYIVCKIIFENNTSKIVNCSYVEHRNLNIPEIGEGEKIGINGSLDFDGSSSTCFVEIQGES